MDSTRFSDRYQRYETLPIIDYHSHLSAERIAENRSFANLSELWIDEDHYKWRAMRIAGEADVSPSGQLKPREKFAAFVRTLQKMPGSPLQSWAKLELSSTFGIDKPLIPATADDIWEQTQEALCLPAFGPREIIARANTQLLCTTDDPTSLLTFHRKHGADPTRRFAMFPSFRPDAALHLANTADFIAWLDCLEASSDTAVTGFASFLTALRQRFADFHALGCRVSDHGLEQVYARACNDAQAGLILQKLRDGTATHEEITLWRGRLLREFAEWDAEHGWTMLLHLGARRNINRRIAGQLGLDAGCDAIGDFPQGESLSRFLDDLDAARQLPRVILFNSNPADSMMFATIAGSYFEENVPGKVQLGPPWWFLDQRRGIRDYINTLGAVGVLGMMPGMVTDSRSFLSISRHAYFRRIVLELLQQEVDDGRIDPRQLDMDALCTAMFYENAKNFFAWELQ